MKRALSLIIVFTMILCMIPFSAFAAPVFEGGEDFVDGQYVLNADNEYTVSNLLWTATKAGSLSFTVEAVLPELGEDQVAPEVGTPIILVDGTPLEYEEGTLITVPIEVEATGYQITITDAEAIGGTFSVVANFTGLPGTVDNPYLIKNPAAAEEGDEVITEITVAAGETAYCTLVWFGGETVEIAGAGISVEGYTAVENVVSIDVPVGGPMSVAITNNGAEEATYTFTMIEKVIPVGTMDNPEEVPVGTYEKAFVAGAEPYYYKYIAEGNGTVKVTLSAADAEGNAIGWYSQTQNATTYAQNDCRWFDSDPAVNPDTMVVSEGDEIVVFVQTFNRADQWNAPAGTVTTTIEFVAEGAEEPAGNTLVLGDNENIAPGSYTFNATEAGGLSVAVTSLIVDGEDLTSQLTTMAWFMNFGLYVNGSGDGSATPAAVNVAAGDVVTIEFTRSPSLMGSDIKATLTLTLGEEVVVVPGTMDNPIVIEFMPWEVTHTGEYDVYYSYTATDNCLIKATKTAGYLSIDNSIVYNNTTSYVEVAAGETIIINPWGSADGTFTAHIVTELPAPNGSSNFPYEITSLPYEATNSDPDCSMFYKYTATGDTTLIFSGEGYYVQRAGGWESALDENDQVVVTAGDVLEIEVYSGCNFKVETPAAVATIGDVAYYSVESAAAAAGAGETIVLLADASATGIVLNAGANLDLGGYTLTTPYLVAFAGSEVTNGSVAAANMVAPNVIIDEVEYAWTANEGVYTLAPVVVPVQNPVAKIGDTPYATVEDALNAAKKDDVVVMIANDTDNAEATLLIKGGVSLNLSKYTLKAANIVGLSGSVIYGDLFAGKTSAKHAKLEVGKANVVLTTDPYVDSLGYDNIPVWDPNNNVYVFSRFKCNSKMDNTYGLTVTDEKIYFKFKHQATQKTLDDLLKDSLGADDNALKVVIRLEWTTDTGIAYQDFVYNAYQVKQVSGSYAYNLNLFGYQTLQINLESLRVTPIAITDSGMTVVGDSWGISGLITE